MNKNAATLTELIRSMTAEEIILNMVKALTNPEIEIDMSSYGHTSYRFDQDEEEIKVCVGCAATASLCRLRNGWYSKEDITLRRFPREDVFLLNFEYAINELRKGDIETYNWFADKSHFARIVNTFEGDYHSSLKVHLDNDFKEEDLDIFVALAVTQPKTEEEVEALMI